MATIDDWQHWAASHLTDELRWMSPGDAWKKVHFHGSNIARAARKGLDNPRVVADAERAVASQMIWLLATCERLDFSLMEATWAKYPAVCPYCVRDSQEQWSELLQAVQASQDEGDAIFHECKCVPPKSADYADVKDLIWLFRTRLDIRPTTIAGFERMFERIYRRAHLQTPFASIAFHVDEEIGEVTQEIMNCDLERCMEEVADAFSWLASLAAHPEFKPQSNRQFGVEHVLRRHFGGPDLAAGSVR